MINPELPVAAGRVYRAMAVIATAGVVAAAAAGGAAAGIGFATGAAFSIVNFWFWHRMVRRVGEPESSEGAPRQGSTVLFALRYLLFGAVLYVILHYFEGSLLAALAGCFVAVAAVILEILVELIYGT